MPTEPYCTAVLNHLSGASVTAVPTQIQDGRRATPTSWQDRGFELVQHKSAVTDWSDEADVQQHYYQEMATIAKTMTGADATLVSGHISRNPAQAKVHADYAPIQFAHSDFTATYGDLVKQRYAQGLEFEANSLAQAGLTLDDLTRAEHIVILQFWRNVGAELMDLPLAFCDARTVPADDLVAFNVPSYAGGDFSFDTFGLAAGANVEQHQWYVFPLMKPTEVVAFRTFDSRMQARGEHFWTPHCAFADPHAPVNAPQRSSIEVRATCLFY